MELVATTWESHPAIKRGNGRKRGETEVIFHMLYCDSQAKPKVIIEQDGDLEIIDASRLRFKPEPARGR